MDKDNAEDHAVEYVSDLPQDHHPDDEAAVARGVDIQEIPPGYWWSFRFLGSTMGAFFLAVSLYIGFVMPASCIQVINQDIGPSPLYIFITSGGTLVTGVGLILVGRLGDIVGRRYFLIGGTVFGILSGIVGGRATSMNMMIGSAVLQGFAASAQFTFPYIIQELVPNKHRGFAQAVMVIGTVPIAGFGAVLTRLLIENTEAGWRWCYYLYSIFNGLTFVLLVLCYYPPSLHQLHTTLTWKSELMRIDYMGIFLYAAGLVLILLGLVWGGAAYPWDSAHVLGTLIVGIVLVIAFGCWETFVPLQQPLLPVKILKNRTYIACVVMASVGQMVYVCISVLWPTEIAALFTTDNVKIGWYSVTFGVGMCAGSIIMGPLFKVIGKAKWQLIVSSGGMTAALGGMAGVDRHRPSVAIALTTLCGFFTGWMELVTIVVPGLVNEPHDIGLANGFLASTRAVASSVAVSIFVAILNGRMKVNLPKDVAGAAVSAGLPAEQVGLALQAVTNGTAAAVEAVPGMTQDIAAAIADGVKTAYSDSFQTVYLSGIAFAGCCVVAAFFTRNVDHLLTDFVSRRIRGAVATSVNTKALDEKIRSVEN